MFELDVAFEELNRNLDALFESDSKTLNAEFQNYQENNVVGHIPIASETTLGGIKVGENLKITNGVLSVDTATDVEKDNTKPVTSAAVHTQLGNIEVLLANL